MPNHPKVKFIIDVEEDKENYTLFRKYSMPKFLGMFLPSDLYPVLDESVSKNSAKRIVDKYVEEKFESDREKIAKHTEGLEKRWSRTEAKYFNLVDPLFKNHPWPKGKYIGYASVFNMYPRDVQNKIFYFSGLRNDARFALATVAHEMLHFMFYDYIKHRYGIKEDDEFEGKDPRYVWNISETFNLVIETWVPYQKIFKTTGTPYDKAHAKMFPKMKKLWDEKEDIDHLLDYYFKAFKK